MLKDKAVYDIYAETRLKIEIIIKMYLAIKFIIFQG